MTNIFLKLQDIKTTLFLEQLLSIKYMYFSHKGKRISTPNQICLVYRKSVICLVEIYFWLVPVGLTASTSTQKADKTDQ